MTKPVDDGDRWVRRFHPADHDAPTLVCFPHAGGAASYFFTMSAQLSPTVRVLALQYPGRQDRRKEPFADSIPKLADGIFDALSPRVEGTFALFGHSMGAILAFEVARRLERRAGVSPALLFASGRRAPSTVREENVHLRDDDAIVAEMKRLSGTDAGVFDDEELIRLVLPTMRADYRAIETYQGQADAVVGCPITVIVGDADPKTTVDEAAAWESHTSTGFDIRVFPGGHFQLADRWPEIASIVSAALA